jgi:hypothetical protein
MKRYLLALLALTVLLFCQGVTVVKADSVIGVFSNPVLAGNVLDDPTVGSLTSLDNSATAAVGVNSANTSCTGSNSLCWGANPGSGLPTSQQYSELTFTGATVAAGSASQPIGTITYLNGTSALTSLIFGATLNFYDNSVSAANFLGSDTVIISTTSNQATVVPYTPAELATDADYINICGHSSNICASSLEAYEDSEGGTGVTATLYGSIVGDPHLTLTGITVPASEAATGGVIGSEPPLGVPEPSALALISAGMLLCAGFLARRP